MANDKLIRLGHLKLSAMRCAAMVTSKISELTTAITEDLAELDNAKQDKITFDTMPKEGSTNPVTSDGVVKYANDFYVNNRTHWAEEVTELIVSETTATSQIELLDNNVFYGTYIVTIDAIQYICETGTNEWGGFVLGDTRISNPEDTNNTADVPFCVVSYWDYPITGGAFVEVAFADVYYPDSNSHTIKIERLTGETTYHQLDENYIPDTIARTSDLEKLDSSKADKKTGVFYINGTGTTAGTWLGSHADITEYYDGLMVMYKVGIAGLSGGTTLNINNLGAVTVVRNVSTAVSTAYAINSVVCLTYTTDSSGTSYWKVADYDSDTKTRSSNKTGTKMYIIGASSQSTSGQTTYSNSNCYIGTDNCLYSGGKKVQTALTFDTTPTSGSSNPITSGGVYAAIGDINTILDEINGEVV